MHLLTAESYQHPLSYLPKRKILRKYTSMKNYQLPLSIPLVDGFPGEKFQISIPWFHTPTTNEKTPFGNQFNYQFFRPVL